MLGSATASGRPSARADAPARVAFHSMHSVAVPRVLFSRLNTQPMRTPVNASPIPSRTSRMTRGQYGRYTFTGRDLHSLLLAGLPAHALST